MFVPSKTKTLPEDIDTTSTTTFVDVVCAYNRQYMPRVSYLNIVPIKNTNAAPAEAPPPQRKRRSTMRVSTVVVGGEEADRQQPSAARRERVMENVYMVL